MGVSDVGELTFIFIFLLFILMSEFGCQLVIFVLGVLLGLSRTFIRRDNIIIYPFVELLHDMVPVCPAEPCDTICSKRPTHLEFNGSSEFSTQLLIPNCSRNSFTR